MIKQVDDIQSLESFTNEIGVQSEYFNQNFSKFLYHYTDINAMISILTNHDLWLTNCRYSNDEHEITHGYDITRSVIRERILSSDNQEYKEYCKQVDKALNEPPQGVYICCFCEINNLLSQWRSYGHNGSGVNIGFDPNAFQWITWSDIPPEEIGIIRILKVIYKNDEKRDIIEKTLDLKFKMHNSDGLGISAQKASEAIHFFIPTFKDEDFAEENERRMIFTPSKDCKVNPLYRHRDGMLVPYYSLQTLLQEITNREEILPVKSVMIGPGIRKEINKESVEMLLPHYKYDGVEVEVSDTPYRG